MRTGVRIQLDEGGGGEAETGPVKLVSMDGGEGEEIVDADVVFMATGVKPSAPGLLAEDSTDNGYACTDAFARVREADGTVFAFGDCVTGEPKTGAKIMANQKAIAGNILATLDALEQEKDLKQLDEG